MKDEDVICDTIFIVMAHASICSSAQPAADSGGAQGGEDSHPLQRLRGGGGGSGLRQEGRQAMDAANSGRQGIANSPASDTFSWSLADLTRCLWPAGCHQEGAE